MRLAGSSLAAVLVPEGELADDSWAALLLAEDRLRALIAIPLEQISSEDVAQMGLAYIGLLRAQADFDRRYPERN